MSLHANYKKKLMPFLRYNDSITASWYLSENYEHHINETIDHFIKKKYNNFFIDIGANIGLTTIQNYQKFDSTHCFEPNSTVFNILKTNIKICCNDLKKINLHNVGLGKEKGKFSLNVPRNNFGGAFIKDNNSYNFETLAKKDGLDSFESKNYFTEEVIIEDQNFLKSNVFDDLKKESKGVIKIDVEGYELQIIELLIKSIPTKEFAIIFENWMDIPKSSITKILEKNNLLKYELFTISYPKFLNKPLPFFSKMKLKKINSGQKSIKGGYDVLIHFSK